MDLLSIFLLSESTEGKPSDGKIEEDGEKRWQTALPAHVPWQSPNLSLNVSENTLSTLRQ